MKIFAAFIVFGVAGVTFAQTPKSQVSSAQRTGAALASIPDRPGLNPRVFIRGWEIVSVSATRRSVVTEASPEYVDRRQSGERKTSLAPAKGQFLIVELRYVWASNVPPTDPLWDGKPDFTLYDDSGAVYKCVGALSREGGEFRASGMTAKRGLPGRGLNRALVYFDVPADGRNFRIVLGPKFPPISLSSASDLPTGEITIPN